jgi:cytochrome bd-type quinol oxidase subunit 2
MATVTHGGHILGTEVGSTAPLFLAVLAVHVLAALAAVLTGATAALTSKGSPRHVRAGRWYYRALTGVFGTALALTAMRPRQDYHLALIGAVAFTAATVGYLHRRRRRPGDAPHIIGMGLSYIAMLTAFYVDNGPHLPLWNRLPGIAFWVLPTAVGAPLIAHALRRVHRSRTDTRGRPARTPRPR